MLSQGTISSFLLPDALWMPGYPVFLAVLVWLKMSLSAMVFVQNVLAGLTAVMIYWLGVKVFNSPFVGIVAGIIFSFEPMSIYWNALLMSDNLASFLFLFSVCLFASKRYYASAFVMGLAALTRPINLYLFPIFLIMYVYQYKNVIGNSIFSMVRERLFWKKIFLMACVFFFTIFPWMVRNKIQFNSWELSSDGWYALHYFASRTFADRNNIPYSWPPVNSDYYSKYPNDVHRLYYVEFFNVPYYKKYLFDLISQRPADFAKFHFISVLKGFDNHDYRYIVRYVLLAKVPQFNTSVANALIGVGQGVWIILFGFAAVGFLVKGKREWQFFFISFYLANTLLMGYVGTVTAGGRYNLPFLPLTLLVASYGGFLLFKRKKQLCFLNDAYVQ
ncbi:MAG: hypothetical protein HYS44_03835 [Candidatus Niyogibacteria bacterium]|nr:hypothetical protein [Candidatus Niyogibacteria bacterium]